MCDICSIACSVCGEVELSVHIADYCVPRESVHPVCHICLSYENGLAMLNLDGGIGAHLFIDVIETAGQETLDGKPVGVVGKPVLFCVDSNEAHGICLN